MQEVRLGCGCQWREADACCDDCVEPQRCLVAAVAQDVCPHLYAQFSDQIFMTAHSISLKSTSSGVPVATIAGSHAMHKDRHILGAELCTAVWDSSLMLDSDEAHLKDDKQHHSCDVPGWLEVQICSKDKVERHEAQADVQSISKSCPQWGDGRANLVMLRVHICVYRFHLHTVASVCSALHNYTTLLRRASMNCQSECMFCWDGTFRKNCCKDILLGGERHYIVPCERTCAFRRTKHHGTPWHTCRQRRHSCEDQRSTNAMH